MSESTSYPPAREDEFVIVCGRVFDGEALPVRATRGEPDVEDGDSGWQVICDADHTTEEATQRAKVVHLGHILEQFPDLAPHLLLPGLADVDWCDETESWVRTERP